MEVSFALGLNHRIGFGSRDVGRKKIISEKSCKQNRKRNKLKDVYRTQFVLLGENVGPW